MILATSCFSKRFSSVLFLFLISACASTPKSFSQKSSASSSRDSRAEDTASMESNQAPSQAARLMSPGNAIRLSSTDDRRLNGVFRIEFDGSLTLPYRVVLADASKKTFEQLSSEIREKFKPFFTGSVQIGIEVSDRRVYVDVRGLVSKPAKYLVPSNSGLDEILAMAGGVQPGAQADEVHIRRADKSSDSYGMALIYEGVSPLNSWTGGETIFFRPAEGRSQFRDADREAQSVQVLGEVRSPGLILHKPGADLLFYLSRAEGPTGVADMERIDIVRGNIPNSERVVVEWSHLNKAPQLQPGDIVIVRAKEPSWIDKAVPVVSAITSILGTILLFVIVL